MLGLGLWLWIGSGLRLGLGCGVRVMTMPLTQLVTLPPPCMVVGGPWVRVITMHMLS